MQLRAAVIICSPPGKLGVSYGMELRGELDLIQHYLFRSHILYMSHTAVGEDVPFYLQLSEHLLQFSKDLLDFR